VQAVAVSEGDFPHLPAAESRGDVGLDHQPIVGGRGLALAHEVLGLEALNQIGNGRRRARVLDRTQRIPTGVDLALQLLGPLPRHRRVPIGKRANGDPPLPAGGRGICQHEGPRVVGGNPRAEAFRHDVVSNPIARGGRLETPDDGVGEAGCEKSAVFPRLRLKAAGKLCPIKALGRGVGPDQPPQHDSLGRLSLLK
jgi:hypothetical protein